jgi:hypothetical protein
MIMNEVRCILQVFRLCIDVQRLTEDVSKLRAAGMVQGTAHLGQVIQRGLVRRLMLCAAKDEISVYIMGRKLCCNFLRKSRL